LKLNDFGTDREAADYLVSAKGAAIISILSIPQTAEKPCGQQRDARFIKSLARARVLSLTRIGASRGSKM